jgi:hypothetical protein
VSLGYQASPLVVLSALLLTDINLGFLTEGKPCCYIHHSFLLGFPTGWSFIQQSYISLQNKHDVIQPFIVASKAKEN